MKTIVMVLAIISLSLFSCKNSGSTGNDEPQAGYTRSEGLITGADYRKCMCCGGWFVRINSDTLRIFNMPPDFSDTLSGKTLPVKVSLDWKKMTEGCGSTMPKIIEVSKISFKL